MRGFPGLIRCGGEDWGTQHSANHRRCSGLWPSVPFDKPSDEADGQEAHEKRGSLAAPLGNDGALAACERVDGDAGDVFCRLQVAAAKDAGAGDLKELAFRSSGAERGNLHAEARDFGGDAEGKEAVECLGGRVGGEVGDRLKAGGGGEDKHPAATPLDHARNEETREANDGFAVDAYLAEFL